MIGFTAPWALLGLIVAAVPLLLHLFARREPPTVVFPATRYLAETARARHRRLTLQHWLLLLVRTLLIAALALAAAGPTMPASGVATHAPAAMVVILDNSLSSAATVDGTPVLDRLRLAAKDVLRAARSEDALWLMGADGVPRRGSAADLEAMVDRMVPVPRRLDLGRALSLARDAIAGQSLPGVVAVMSDLQATAVAAATSDSGTRPVGLVVVRPEEQPVPNLGIAGLSPGRQPWSNEGGRVSVTTTEAGGATRSVALSVRFGQRAPRQQLVGAGATASVPSGAMPSGWWPVLAELESDELRLDDSRRSAVRIAPPARAVWSPEERFLAVAADVLLQNGRLARGTELTIGSLGSGASIVQPPADAAALGALNRALAARGVGWRYGDPVSGSAVTDSAAVLGRHAVLRRVALLPPGGSAGGSPGASSGDVLVTALGSPWLVRSGNVVLLGSRLEPGWTALPLSAEFVPFVDFLANRAVRGELLQIEAAPGDAVSLPAAATELVRDGVVRRTEGGAQFRPSELGLVFLLEARDTIGVLAVNPDPRESDLTRMSDGSLRQLWPGARIVPPREAGAAAFAFGGRADLRGLMLLLAALFALADASLAGWGGIRARGQRSAGHA